jgi:hypothetical protein
MLVRQQSEPGADLGIEQLLQPHGATQAAAPTAPRGHRRRRGAGTFSTHVATLNTTAFAGYTDWRVPNVRELHSIVNYQNSLPSVSTAFNNNCLPGCTVLTCSCTAGNERYYSSTSRVNTPAEAWFNQEQGVTVINKANNGKARAVRGGP